ncbi:DUF421 domain-containing protein [Marinobacter nanhaiticus D15-8W]|uniref:DUF421 domain-containing protein n=1 Tax=Marinobacter nanhaiticus D15-8W TaxID=626887 RepID=N6WQ70_9GAMM|nr:YetF domain-containing protein [Marinobacter nanhaiticus]ENO13187.1 DUF421 domain-containing protein [Marinobacter nanhaiticus D15-8W]BES70548.1 DUF421 domain-containing protein [Marinobacter nanhaiticus D15-8W]
MENILYDGWQGLARILIVGILAYISLILCLRISGKRTLAKMNAFDLVVTVSLGSTLASIILSDGVALAEGVGAFVLLITLQFVVTWSSVRIRWVRQIVTGEPQLLLHGGHFVSAALRRARVTKSEVRAAVRSAGISDLNAVQAVVLETDGSFSVVRGADRPENSSLVDVRGMEARDHVVSPAATARREN